ncbi:MAG: GIY-YIG nuclease family protein [Candidatus Kerfeldbacteria bacterium]|nr:GIY-YIG nuclease family protein [Candidatus Kerfeldbacteria bacterium]
MYFLYIIECADTTLYTGITVDVARRVHEHNASRLGSKYTRARRPVKLVYSKKFRTRAAASRAEYRLKKISRAAKERLIHMAQTGGAH